MRNNLRPLPNYPGYWLVHLFLDDSRDVEDANGDTMLTFDSSLGVHKGGRRLGLLCSSATNWNFLPEDGGPAFDTGVDVNDYHWTNLELAEVAVAEHLLKG